MGINTRGTYCVTQACLPHLKKSSHAHILNNSPPLNMNPIWFKNHVAYTMAKYGMSMCVLGMAEELRDYKIGKIGVPFVISQVSVHVMKIVELALHCFLIYCST